LPFFLICSSVDGNGNGDIKIKIKINC